MLNDKSFRFFFLLRNEKNPEKYLDVTFLTVRCRYGSNLKRLLFYYEQISLSTKVHFLVHRSSFVQSRISSFFGLHIKSTVLVNHVFRKPVRCSYGLQHVNHHDAHFHFFRCEARDRTTMDQRWQCLWRYIGSRSSPCDFVCVCLPCIPRREGHCQRKRSKARMSSRRFGARYFKICEWMVCNPTNDRHHEKGFWIEED